MRISSWLEQARSELEQAGCESPRLDAELMLAAVLEVEREYLYTEPGRSLTVDQLEALAVMLKRRLQREPLAYILGKKPFRYLEIEVGPQVLIPRPETELLVDRLIELPQGAAVIDVGTGSGAIALALKDERPDMAVTACDISSMALELARSNAERLGLDINFVHSDLLARVSGSFDCLVSNPPYISAQEYNSLQPEVRLYEPRGALLGGKDGLEYYRLLVAQAQQHAIPMLLFEIGSQQGQVVADLCTECGYDQTKVIPDLAGLSRIVSATRSNSIGPSS